jgi:N6-L-threonylcarbamoyladenine synthase
MRDRPGFDFSFSGLKTAVMLAARAAPLTDARRADIAASAQEAIVDTLAVKTLRALDETGLSDLVVAGGVGANRLLRERLGEEASARGVKLYFPRLEFCTDNAAMIAVAGLLRLKRGEVAPGLAIQARAQWPLDSLVADGRDNN